jgi:Rrf2 family iron-sulfur cluster assembly transcriptional regulator
VADVITAVDEPIDATKCGGRENCNEEGERCMTHELWTNLNAHIFAYLRSVNLAQLVAEQQKPDVSVMRDHRQPASSRKTEAETIE